MKIIIILILLTITTMVANAQYFIEGSVGVRHDDNSYYSVNHHSSPDFFLFNVLPQVGYCLNDNIAVGTKLSFTYGMRKDMIIDPDDSNQEIERKTKTPEWRFAIFGRYKLWGTGKLSLLIETPVGVGGSIRKEQTGTITKKTHSESIVFINTFPAIIYDLTDKFSLITAFNFLSLDLSFYSMKLEDTGTKHKGSYFNFNTQSTIFNSLSGIKIGFIYNFKKSTR